MARSSFACLRDAVIRSRVDPRCISAVSVANQRASVIFADKYGKAISSVVSWQDLRGGKEIAFLKRDIDERRYYRITGLPNNPVFSLGKILWIKKNEPSFYKKCARIMLVGDYLLRRLGADDFYTDLSNASLTGMLDISRLDWSGEILKVSGIGRDRLGLLVASGQIIGHVSGSASRASGLARGTPIVSGGGISSVPA
jgi:xylulokinase